MKHLFLICVLGSALWLPAVSYCSDAASDEGIDLDELVGAQWYGLYMFGQKAGYVSHHVELDERAGMPVVVERSFMRMVMNVGGDRFRTDSKGRNVYEGLPPYRLLVVEDEEKTGESLERLTVERDGDEFVVKRLEHGRKSEKRVAASKETLRDWIAEERLVQSRPAPGDTVSYVQFNEDELEDVERTLTVLDVSEEEWQGRLRRVVAIEHRGSTRRFVARHLEDGTVVRVTLADGLELRLEDEETAKRLPGRHELFEMRREVAVEGLDADRDEIERLTLEIEGMPPGIVPERPTQRVRRRADGFLVVTLTSSSLPAKPALSDEDRERLSDDLEATDEIQSDHRRIKRRARIIVDEDDDPLEQARAISRWVHRHVEPTAFSNYDTALDVLKHLEGDCTESALLFVALCRAAGIPARQVSGMVYAGQAQQSFGMHRWAQVYVGEWIDVDPGLGQVPAGATHLTLDLGGEKWYALLGALGTMRIGVAGLERKPASE